MLSASVNETQFRFISALTRNKTSAFISLGEDSKLLKIPLLIYANFFGARLLFS